MTHTVNNLSFFSLFSTVRSDVTENMRCGGEVALIRALVGYALLKVANTRVRSEIAGTTQRDNQLSSLGVS